MAHQDTTPDSPSHTSGTSKAEERERHHGDPGWQGATRTSRDATTINPEKRGPIDPRMPQMPPA